MTRSLADILSIYQGSNGDATTALYRELAAIGIAGDVAVNLFRAQKASARAKVYRGGDGRLSFRGSAYDKKQWSMDNLVEILALHADGLGIRWGWKIDPKQAFHNWVLYVDLPTGQVSFHTAAPKAATPGYAGEWDGIRDMAPMRIAKWIVDLLAAKVPA